MAKVDGLSENGVDVGEIERYTPQHPLPEEIKKMTRDETVCHFCGVSYLIHSEIKKLEDKLKKTEKELEDCKGAKAREKSLLAEIEEWKEKFSELEKSFNIKESEISTFSVNIKCQKDLIEQLTTEKNGLKLKNDQLQEKVDTLPSLLSDIQTYKLELKDLKSIVVSTETEMRTHIQTVLPDLATVFTNQTNDYNRLKSEFDTLQMEKHVITQSTSSLKEKLQERDLELKKYSALETENIDLNEKVKSLNQEISNYRHEVDKLKSEHADDHLRIKKYKSDLNEKDKELENLSIKVNSQDHQAKEMISRLQKEVTEKENSLVKVHDELKKVEGRLHDQQRKEATMNEKTALMENENKSHSEQINKLKDELDKLKGEREEMIAIHQNRIEDLRGQFKLKSKEVEEWPDKLDQALKNERSKYAQDLKLLENKLKENFIMELEIEKDKYKELMAKFQSVNKDKEDNWKEEIIQIENKYKTELSQLKQAVSESKRQGLEREAELQREVNSLKDIIKDLEERLGKLDSGNSEVIVNLKNKLRQTKLELEDAVTDMNKMSDSLKNSKQEIQFLQDTVRKECEERFELTESLCEARKELLAFKKPLGGYNSVTPNRKNSLTSILSDKSDISQNSNDKSLNGRVSKDNVTPPNNKSLNNVAQNRRRIANILGKQS